jgi:hypothetical protein
MLESTGQISDGAVRILVGTPCSQGGLTREYLQSMLALQRRCDELGWQLTVQTRVDGLVTRTRNIFGSRMVRDDAFTHLLMVDSDIGFEPGVVERLVDSGHSVVGACVPLREVRWNEVAQAVERRHGPRQEADAQGGAAGEDPGLTAAELESLAHQYAVAFYRGQERTVRAPVEGFLPARFVGGAMLLAGREVFTELAESDLVDHYRTGAWWSDWPPDGWTFFDPVIDPGTGNYLSEDYAFCHRWLASGGSVWVDLHSRVSHTGAVTVRGDIALSLRTQARTRPPAGTD